MNIIIISIIMFFPLTKKKKVLFLFLITFIGIRFLNHLKKKVCDSKIKKPEAEMLKEKKKKRFQKPQQNC